MIKRKVGIDNNVALKKACENNSIILTTKGVNSKPVSYVDLKGKGKILDTKFKISDSVKNNGIECIKRVAGFNVGDTIRVYVKAEEGNREKIRVFEGVVLKKQGSSSRETFTVRKTSNGIGVEKTWLVHSPNVEKIEVIRRGNARRSNLVYLKKRKGKKVKVKFQKDLLSIFED